MNTTLASIKLYTLSPKDISNKNEYKPRETASYTILARNADGSLVKLGKVQYLMDWLVEFDLRCEAVL